jgi:uncharacterized protein YkwD
MAVCEACGTDSDNFLFTCNQCGLKLCSDCRLPEQHFCAVLRKSDSSSSVEECKSENCTNESDYDSKYCPECLNEQAEDESTRELFGETECISKSCSNVAGHNNRYCLDCRRKSANSDSSPPVETVDGSPYNNATSGGYSRNRGSILNSGSVFETARSACSRAWNFGKFVLVMVLGLLVVPFLVAKKILNVGLHYSRSTPVLLVVLLGVGLVAGSQFGVISVNSEPIDEFASDVDSWVNDTASEATDSEPLNESTIEELVHEEVNERRANHDVRELRYSSELAEVARAHARDMAQRDYFSHTSLEGRTPKDRYVASGIYCSPGENIAMTHAKVDVITENGTKYYDTNQEVAEGIVNQWMNSPGHRKNILRSSFLAEGIGVAIEDDPDEEGVQVYVVQNFCA